MSEESTKYQEEWEDYKNRQADSALVGIILFVLFIGLVVFGANYPEYEIVVPIGFFTAAGIFSIFTAYRYIFGNSGKCPRCKKVFNYPNDWRTDRCRNCRLPKYYGSPYFYDQWGTEQGNDFAKRIKEGKL